ncbi:MAG: helix-turn-helix domain-containing protein [Desulfobacterales bacterium]|uniref:Helix-turn-helix domain-containing protein n=1 Tax=Candidatus Desulfaltia bathyphila TaxID=2841697 RepID=A0A8J6TBF2_9BACT|nr:helix-turn-helix domain-containing protein [Candidatus Desulfaltia bathyphila]MBL7196247.1 helix-turn-helix domain-containing protein [Desulfobacterales bacterium]MBL7207747.1 helix-turn-helix domain-containing protein [Desulfobacterales bacterium]
MELINFKSSIYTRGQSVKLDIDAVNKALLKTGGNKAKTAKVLGVGRATLYRFLGDHPAKVSINDQNRNILNQMKHFL